MPSVGKHATVSVGQGQGASRPLSGTPTSQGFATLSQLRITPKNGSFKCSHCSWRNWPTHPATSTPPGTGRPQRHMGRDSDVLTSQPPVTCLARTAYADPNEKENNFDYRKTNQSCSDSARRQIQEPPYSKPYHVPVSAPLCISTSRDES